MKTPEQYADEIASRHENVIQKGEGWRFVETMSGALQKDIADAIREAISEAIADAVKKCNDLGDEYFEKSREIASQRQSGQPGQDVHADELDMMQARESDRYANRAQVAWECAGLIGGNP